MLNVGLGFWLFDLFMPIGWPNRFRLSFIDWGFCYFYPMRTDLKDPNLPQPPSTNPLQNKNGLGGCFSMFFYLMGFATIGISLIGFILSFFDRVLEIQGSKLPMINLEIFIPLMVCALIFLLFGWLISKLSALIRKNKQKKQSWALRNYRIIFFQSFPNSFIYRRLIKSTW